MKFFRRLLETAAPAAAPIIGAPLVHEIHTDEAATGEAAGQTVKSRIAAILESPEAEGRRKLATHLALNTDLSARDAIATLSASAREHVGAAVPEGPPESPKSARARQAHGLFSDMMRQHPEYAIKETPATDPPTEVARIVGNYHLAAGIKVES
jgi:hypothetical protein